MLLLTGCISAQPSSDPNAKPLLWLEHADVNADFRHYVLERHDTRFIAVYGYGTDVPGVGPDLQYRLVRKGRIRCIEGTSDAISSPEYGRLVDKAYDYAKRYNTLLLHYLRDHPKA